MNRLVALVLAGLSAAASAQVYTWTDKDGVLHFTDNPSAVPASARAKVTQGDHISTVSNGPAAEPVKAAAAPGPAPSAVAPGAAEELARVEQLWRAAFRELNERIARLEDEIELDRKKVEDLNGLPVGARFQCLYGGGFWGTPIVGLGGAGASVSVGAVSQGLPGFAVGGQVGVQSSQVVMANSGVATAPCVFAFNPEFERSRERLELNRKALARARTELAQLDRRASFDAVPREWRR